MEEVIGSTPIFSTEEAVSKEQPLLFLNNLRREPEPLLSVRERIVWFWSVQVCGMIRVSYTSDFIL
jgi:hypothetical protein